MRDCAGACIACASAPSIDVAFPLGAITTAHSCPMQGEAAENAMLEMVLPSPPPRHTDTYKWRQLSYAKPSHMRSLPLPVAARSYLLSFRRYPYHEEEICTQAAAFQPASWIAPWRTAY